MNFVKVDAEGLKKFDIKNKKIYSVTPIQNGGEIFKWVDFVIVFEDENKYIILNHFVKSTEKTPKKEIEKAIRLIKERETNEKP